MILEILEVSKGDRTFTLHPQRLWDVLPSPAKGCLGPERQKDNSAPCLDVPPLPHFGGIFVPGLEGVSSEHHFESETAEVIGK